MLCYGRVLCDKNSRSGRRAKAQCSTNLLVQLIFIRSSIDGAKSLQERVPLHSSRLNDRKSLNQEAGHNVSTRFVTIKSRCEGGIAGFKETAKVVTLVPLAKGAKAANAAPRHATKR